MSRLKMSIVCMHDHTMTEEAPKMVTIRGVAARLYFSAHLKGEAVTIFTTPLSVELCWYTYQWHYAGTLDWHSAGALDWHSAGTLDWHSAGTLDWHSVGILDWHSAGILITNTMLVHLPLAIYWCTYHWHYTGELTTNTMWVHLSLALSGYTYH